MAGEVIPFGKYRGKEISDLLGDDDYLKWLLEQPWFKQRYGTIYSVIINHYGQEVTETPAHNAMQVKFLKEEHQKRFFGAAQPISFKEFFNKPAILALMKANPKTLKQFMDEKPDLEGMRQYMIECDLLRFEEKGADVSFQVYSLFDTFVKKPRRFEFRIELKPTMGDDFPEVLRQMQRNDVNYLLVGQCNAAGASEKEIKAFFAYSDKKMILEHELSEVALPEEWYGEDLVDEIPAILESYKVECPLCENKGFSEDFKYYYFPYDFAQQYPELNRSKSVPCCQSCHESGQSKPEWVYSILCLLRDRVANRTK